MKTGTSGSVSSITAGRDRVDRGDEDEHRDRDGDGEHDLRQIARERRLERVDAADRRRRDLGALGAVERSRLDRAAAARRASRRSCESTSVAARRPTTSKPQRCRRPADEAATSRTSGTVSSSRARSAEGAGRDGGDQHGLREHEQRGDDAESDVEREQRAHGTGATDQARVERSHDALRAGLAWEEIRRRRLVVAAEPRAEDVVRPGLVEQDDGAHDQRDDASSP